MSQLSRIKLLTNKILVKRTTQLQHQNHSLESDNSFLKGLISIGKQTNKNIKIDSLSIKNNRRILLSILSALRAIQTQVSGNVSNVNKIDTVEDPLSRFKKKDASGIGLLGAIGLGASVIGKVFGLLAGPIIKSIAKITKWIGKLALRLGITGAKFVKKTAESIWDWIKEKKSGKGWKVLRRGKVLTKRIIPRAITGITSRLGTQIVTRLGIGAVASLAGGTVATVAGIGLLVAAIGYGSYKLASYFKLGEKLDNLISKTTNGKYRDLADILMGIKSGDIASDITTWLKDKALSFFNNGYEFIKGKISGLLEKLNPFSAGKKSDALEISKSSGSASSLQSAVAAITQNKANSDTDAPEALIDSNGQVISSNIGNTAETAGSSLTSKAINAVSSMIPAGSAIKTAASIGSAVINSDVGKAVSSGLSSAGSAIVDGVKSAADFVTGVFSPNETGDKSTSGGFTHFPTKNKTLISAFGMRMHPEYNEMRMHQGVDIAVPIGTSVFSAKDGTVKYTKVRSGYGKTIEVDHGNGYSTLYAHLDKYAVKTGDRVKGGQVIAKSGNTGVSKGPHLHFEIAKGGVRENPVNHLKFSGLTVMGKNGHSRAPKKGELGYGNGGASSVKGIPGALGSVSGRSETHRYNHMPNQLETPRIAPMFSEPQHNTAFSGMATIENQSAIVESPRIISSSIALASQSVLYT